MLPRPALSARGGLRWLHVHRQRFEEVAPFDHVALDEKAAALAIPDVRVDRLTQGHPVRGPRCGGEERSCDSTRARGCIVGWRGSFPFEPRALGFQLETAAVWPGRHEWREGHARSFREDTADLRHAIGCGRASPCGFAVLSLELERRVGAEGERPGQDRHLWCRGSGGFRPCRAPPSVQRAP